MKKHLVLCIIAFLTLATLCSAQDEGSVWSSKKSGWQLLTPVQRITVFDFATPFMEYLASARSAESSTREIIKRAKAAGFTELTTAAQVRPGAKLIIPARDRALILTVIGTEPITAGSRMVGTHHDSPHIDLKARPVVAAKKAGLALFKTIYYGGIKKYQWANVPLALIGRIDVPDPAKSVGGQSSEDKVADRRSFRTIQVSIGLDPTEPVFVIADNAPHSDKELRDRSYTDVFKGEEMDPVAGSVPGDDDSVMAEVLHALENKYHIREEDFVSADLELVPATMPRDVGIDRGLIGAYGQDDRLSSYCAARAIMDIATTPKFTAIAYLSNFEEVGSINN